MKQLACPRVSKFPDCPPLARHGIFCEFQTEEEEDAKKKSVFSKEAVPALTRKKADAAECSVAELAQEAGLPSQTP